MTILEFKKYAALELKDFSPSVLLDVRVLLEHCLNLSKTQLLLQENNQLDDKSLTWLNNAIQKRKTGLPIAYITNHKEFFGYDFFVDSSVLIPKADTEILVEKAITIILEKINARKNSLITICDMCTGTGCITLSIFCTLIEKYKIPLEKFPTFTLVDISEKALNIATKNAEILLQKYPQYKSLLRFVRSNLFEQIPHSFDVILTNPPYVPHSMVEELLKDGRSEPVLALDGDITLFGERATDTDGKEADDGLCVIKNLILQINEHLCPMGTVLMETGEYNAQETASFAQVQGYKTQIFTDLEGQLRVVQMN